MKKSVVSVVVVSADAMVKVDLKVVYTSSYADLHTGVQLPGQSLVATLRVRPSAGVAIKPSQLKTQANNVHFLNLVAVVVAATYI